MIPQATGGERVRVREPIRLCQTKQVGPFSADSPTRFASTCCLFGESGVCRQPQKETRKCWKVSCVALERTSTLCFSAEVEGLSLVCGRVVKIPRPCEASPRSKLRARWFPARSPLSKGMPRLSQGPVRYLKGMPEGPQLTSWDWDDKALSDGGVKWTWVASQGACIVI